MGCDFIFKSLFTDKTVISIHAPIVGCDISFNILSASATDFNPRTHRGVRLLITSASNRSNIHFNPRTHRGVRLYFLSISRLFLKFQSTHPSWGATHVEEERKTAYDISIHAPIVGCDVRFIGVHFIL